MPALERNGGGKENRRRETHQVRDEPIGHRGRQMLRHLQRDREIESAIDVQGLGQVVGNEAFEWDLELLAGHIVSVHADHLGRSRRKESREPLAGSAADIDHRRGSDPSLHYGRDRGCRRGRRCFDGGEEALVVRGHACLQGPGSTPVNRLAMTAPATSSSGAIATALVRAIPRYRPPAALASWCSISRAINPATHAAPTAWSSTPCDASADESVKSADGRTALLIQACL
jgi:hypothetical protein